MAKALMGHVGSNLDLRAATELRRLRDRVRELETEVIRLRAENAELTSATLVDEEMRQLTVTEHARDHEPALT
jgi:hypothetical protein